MFAVDTSADLLLGFRQYEGQRSGTLLKIKVRLDVSLQVAQWLMYVLRHSMMPKPLSLGTCLVKDATLVPRVLSNAKWLQARYAVSLPTFTCGT